MLAQHPRPAVVARYARVLARSRCVPSTPYQISAAAITATVLNVAQDADVRVIAYPGEHLVIDRLKQSHVLSVVTLHCPPRLRVA